MNKKRCVAVFILLVILLGILTLGNILLGSVNMSASQILKILSKDTLDTTGYNIIYSIRLPRISAAIMLGGALALSGYLLQTFFSNPIVGPFVLGISSGAKLTVALTMISLLSKGVKISSMGMVVSAFAGSIAAMGFVLLISFKIKNMSILVVCGIMIGYICSAVTDFAVTFADDSNIINLHNWSLGSLSGMNWQDIKIMTIITLMCLIISVLMSKPIGAYRLGEAYAHSMGVNVMLLRVMMILISSLLAACVTAFAGPVSFVGIAVPHLMKSAFKTTAPAVMIPACFLGGGVITLFCDGVARTVFAPTELSISSVTAVFLVPVVLFIMIKRKEKNG